MTPKAKELLEQAIARAIAKYGPCDKLPRQLRGLVEDLLKIADEQKGSK